MGLCPAGRGNVEGETGVPLQPWLCNMPGGHLPRLPRVSPVFFRQDTVSLWKNRKSLLRDGIAVKGTGMEMTSVSSLCASLHMPGKGVTHGGLGKEGVQCGCSLSANDLLLLCPLNVPSAMLPFRPMVPPPTGCVGPRSHASRI